MTYSLVTRSVLPYWNGPRCLQPALGSQRRTCSNSKNGWKICEEGRETRRGLTCFRRFLYRVPLFPVNISLVSLHVFPSGSPCCRCFPYGRLCRCVVFSIGFVVCWHPPLKISGLLSPLRTTVAEFVVRTRFIAQNSRDSLDNCEN